MNAISAFSVVMGIMAIKRKDQVTHQKWMLTALVGSALFLVGYVLYHCVFPDKLFLGQGWIRPVYFFILISHILCTIIGLPFILGTFFFALTQKFEAHKKLARITAPLWLYISITGVMVYLFLHL
jgi:putative membrane protein